MEEENTLEQELRGYLAEKKMSPTENILKFWNGNQSVYPQLYKLATLFFQIPMTEVNVERLFSHVKFILDPLRVNLGAELLNEIMLIRMNIHLFENGQLILVM